LTLHDQKCPGKDALQGQADTAPDFDVENGQSDGDANPALEHFVEEAVATS
jgi:hypothetical protein